MKRLTGARRKILARTTKRLAKTQLHLLWVGPLILLFPLLASDLVGQWYTVSWMVWAGLVYATGLIYAGFGLRSGWVTPVLVGLLVPPLATLLMIFGASEDLGALSWICVALGIAAVPSGGIAVVLGTAPLGAGTPSAKNTSRAELAERMKQVRSRHILFRDRYVATRAGARWVISPILLALMTGSMLLGMMTHPLNGVVTLVMGGLLFYGFAKWLIGPVGRSEAREKRGDRSEVQLINTLEAGDAFGILLRPFGRGGTSGAGGFLYRCGVPFFALEDAARRTPTVGVPTIWVPGGDWGQIAFPLIIHAVVVVIDVSGWSVIQGNPGLHAELRFTVDAGLEHKCVVIRDRPTQMEAGDPQSVIRPGPSHVVHHQRTPLALAPFTNIIFAEETEQRLCSAVQRIAGC